MCFVKELLSIPSQDDAGCIWLDTPTLNFTLVEGSHLNPSTNPAGFSEFPSRTWSFKDPRVGYAGAALMLILSFLTSSRAANNLVEDGTKIMDAKKSQISTSSANRMVRISKGCSQKTRVGGGWMLLGPWSLGWNCETVIYFCQAHYNLVLYSLAIHIFLTAFHLSYCMNCFDLTWPATNLQITPWFHLRCIHFWEVISVATPKSLLHLLSIPRLVGAMKHGLICYFSTTKLCPVLGTPKTNSRTLGLLWSLLPVNEFLVSHFVWLLCSFFLQLYLVHYWLLWSHGLYQSWAVKTGQL